MAGEVDRGSGSVSRRELLKRVGLAGAVAAAPLNALASVIVGPELEPPNALTAQAAGGLPTREALETLTSVEADALDAIDARLIPSDRNGPGAAEARAALYIDRALGGALAESRDAYRAGLAGLDRYAMASKGRPFALVSAADQDALLTDLERNMAPGFTPDSATFFALVRAHTIQGTFCDPYYGGNRNFVGWDLIGYPGLRLAVAPGEQRLDARLTPTHRSAYDHAMFSRRPPARASVDEGGSHDGG